MSAASHFGTLALPSGIEPLSPPRKGGVLTDRRRERRRFVSGDPRIRRIAVSHFRQIDTRSGADDAVPIPENCLRAPARERIVAFARTGKSAAKADLGPIRSIPCCPRPNDRLTRLVSSWPASVSLARGIKARDAKHPFYALYRDPACFVRGGGDQRQSEAAQTSNGVSAPEGSPRREFLRGLRPWVR